MSSIADHILSFLMMMLSDIKKCRNSLTHIHIDLLIDLCNQRTFEIIDRMKTIAGSIENCPIDSMCRKSHNSLWISYFIQGLDKFHTLVDKNLCHLWIMNNGMIAVDRLIRVL